REGQPILIVVESGVDLLLHVGRLAVQLRAKVCSLYGLALLIFSFIRDLVGLGLPNPRTGEIQTGGLYIEGIADRINLPERIKAIGLGNMFGDGWGRLRPGSCGKYKRPQNQETDRR